MNGAGPHITQRVLTSSLAVGNLRQGMKWARLEKASTTTQITVFPLLGGRSVIKSIVTVDQGLEGISMGCNSPRGSPPSLSIIQTGQVVTVSHCFSHPKPPELPAQQTLIESMACNFSHSCIISHLPFPVNPQAYQLVPPSRGFSAISPSRPVAQICLGGGRGGMLWFDFSSFSMLPVALV